MRQPRPYDLRRWRRLRAAQLALEPLCRLCQESGLLTAARDVDHIVPIADGGAFDDPANFRSLCHECHSPVTRAAQTGKPVPQAWTKGVDPDTGIPRDGWWSGRRAMLAGLDREAERADDEHEHNNKGRTQQ